MTKARYCKFIRRNKRSIQLQESILFILIPFSNYFASNTRIYCFSECIVPFNILLALFAAMYSSLLITFAE